MLLSVFIAHSGRDEEDYIEALETVTVDFFIGGDIGIELRLSNEGEDLHGIDSTVPPETPF